MVGTGGNNRAGGRTTAVRRGPSRRRTSLTVAVVAALGAVGVAGLALAAPGRPATPADALPPAWVSTDLPATGRP